ncbi:MAG: transposase [Chloroflexota bacterium]|nr:transposase [Chloroflexota bacterium]
MQNPNLTQQQLNRLIEFRQAVYRSFLTRQGDAQFELVDALLLSRQARSFPELSLSPVFRRRWPSIYAAVEDGKQDVTWLRGYLMDQVPTQGCQLFSLDGTAWPRSQAPTLPDRQYVYSPTPAIDGGSIVVGYPYSILAWMP